MSSHPSLWPQASRKRRALAVYLDYLLFSAAFTLFSWALLKLLPGVSDLPGWAPWASFAVLEIFLLSFAKWSPGNWSLGIFHLQRLKEAQPSLQGGDYRVEPAIFAADRWWTILFGVFFILDGTKVVVRWALWHPPIPFFGTQLSEPASALVSTLLGSAECACGILMLRCNPKVGWVGLPPIAVTLVSNALSYPLWISWLEADIHARRAYQGLQARLGEVEMMAGLAPLVLLAAPALSLVWLLSAWRRIARIREDGGVSRQDAKPPQ